MKLVLCAFLFLIFARGEAMASARTVWIAPFSYQAQLTTQEIQRVYEVFQRRIETYKAWKVISDSSAFQENTCDRDCLITRSRETGADLVFYGILEPGPGAGTVKLTVTLLEPSTWREIQKESQIIGPDIEQDLGKISALAKLFDPEQLSDSPGTPPKQPDAISTTANWILGGSALAILALVIYSLL